MGFGFPHLPTVVRLLIVLDERSTVACRFGTESSGVGLPDGYPLFGLSHVVQMLAATRGMTLTKAHRGTDADADIQNFTFTTSSLADVDVVWIIGSGGPKEPGPIASTEIAALTTFMNKGGGIFATGDHDDYGSAMAAGLPRVQDMRLWNHAVTPQATGKHRVTSIQPSSQALAKALAALNLAAPPPADANANPLPADATSSTLVPFENQSADAPAPIYAKLYQEGPFPNPFWPPNLRNPASRQPLHPLAYVYVAHPLLQMDDGSALKGLPGHMHEGVVPQPGEPATFAGNGNYPSAGGTQPTPDLIAKGQCLSQYDWPQYDDSAFVADYTIPTAYQGPYGVVGAYDGWPVGVGRVAVDSTFHHFFDINLIGDQDCVSGDPRGQGYTASSSGKAALAQIENYHRNLVFWLGHAHTISLRLVNMLVSFMNAPDGGKALKAGAAETEKSYLGLGLTAAGEISGGGTPLAQALDALLIMTAHRILPPWFWGNPGERPVLSAREAAHLFTHALGAAVVELYAAQKAAGNKGSDVDAATLVAILHRGFATGLGHALTAWPADMRPVSAKLRSALESAMQPAA